MNNEELKVKYEGKVEFIDDKNEFLLTITDTALIFKKIRDLINKDYTVVKEINIKDIKTIKNEAMIEYENKKMTIHTREEIFSFMCLTDDEANRIISIIKSTLGLGFIESFEKTGVKIEEGLNEVFGAAKGFVKNVQESEAVKEGTKTIKDAVSGFFDSFK